MSGKKYSFLYSNFQFHKNHYDFPLFLITVNYLHGSIPLNKSELFTNSTFSML